MWSNLDDSTCDGVACAQEKCHSVHNRQTEKTRGGGGTRGRPEGSVGGLHTLWQGAHGPGVRALVQADHVV